MEITKEWLETLLIRDARDKSITKVLKIEQSPAVAKGENYGSDMTRVKMEVVLGSGRKTKKSVVVKEMPSTEIRKAMFAEMGLYLREIMIYRDIIPSMENVLMEVDDRSEPLWGKCLDYTPYSRLVLQDLTECGFVMVNRLKGLDFEHCKLALRALAKFHALSVVLKEKMLIPMEVFGEGIFQKNEKMVTEFHEKMFRTFIDSVDKTWGEEWQPTVTKIKEKILENVTPIMLKFMTRDDSKFNVLIHGDFWLNNMLFKYGVDSNKPTSIRFVDFQLPYYHTPAQDVMHFISTSASASVREQNIPDLVRVYHEQLRLQITALNCSTKPSSLEEFQEEFRNFTLYGVITSAAMLPIMLLKKPELMPDLEKMRKNVLENKPGFLDWLPKDDDDFKNIMKGILRNAEANGSI